MAKRNKPIAGSRAYRPLKRARQEKPRVNSWPSGDSKILGFTGYKAGMTHCIALDENKGSVSSGSEIFVPVTIIEAPPMKVVGVRIYKKGYGGTEAFTDIWCETPEKDVGRRASVPKKPESIKRIADVEKAIGDCSDVRLIACTQPVLTHAPQKIPDITELALSGSIHEKLAHAKEVLGKEVSIKDIFKEKSFIDVISVTKGKGFGGVIKRYGVRKQPSKATGKRRHPGTGGSWHPAHKLWVEPLPGQIGYHTRTEYNKLVLKVGNNGAEVSPAGGFLHYGPVKNDYIMLYGSVPGPAKRIIRLTFPRREHKAVNLTLKHIDLSSKQGA
ncbi:MAG: 50S ribosomal protein L3 [Candidatus Altiarchaeota archaeon]